MCRIALACVQTAAVWHAALVNGEDAASRPLPRTDLLTYQDARGQLAKVSTREEWLQRRADIVAKIVFITGPLPGEAKRCPLEMQVHEEADCGTYLRRLISYSSEPGSRVPAYLLVPKAVLTESQQRAPAVLCLHGTDARIGHKTVVGLGGRANRQYASELAERGYVTLSPSYPLLADYQPDLKKLGWESGTMKAVWDNVRGLDLLESLPFVRAGKFGAIGHSLGGHNAIFTAVFDERIAVVVSSCGFDSFLDYQDGDASQWLTGHGWTQDRYMPRLANYRLRLGDIPFDFHELIAAIAPRQVLAIAPQGDDNFSADSVDKIADAARPVYQLFEMDNALQVEHPDCGHDFTEAMRVKAYRLFDDVLR
ncbi:MAG: alpha/beta hydrolase [Pirellulales bacterium]